MNQGKETDKQERNNISLKKVKFVDDEKTRCRDGDSPYDENSPMKRKAVQKEDFSLISIRRNPFTKSPEQKKELARFRAQQLCIIHELGDENERSTDRNTNGIKMLTPNLSLNPFAELSGARFEQNFTRSNRVRGSKTTSYKNNSENSPYNLHRSGMVNTIGKEESSSAKKGRLHQYDLPHFC
eukprot:CAMPEP_0116020418 /NCGR_PEP_ID=MMETSP0321-20121206/9782_1 /TAXON_ID=163516 /ORGANISM="Leptocylindrus danicus var. danicus, Strain B650" /LENGTH=182 /DNA_ID=CAMNT_0003491099 /DNA_START=73 /DNA_END=621 /DNA_ORIENTATION=+